MKKNKTFIIVIIILVIAIAVYVWYNKNKSVASANTDNKTNNPTSTNNPTVAQSGSTGGSYGVVTPKKKSNVIISDINGKPMYTEVGTSGIFKLDTKGGGGKVKKSKGGSYGVFDSFEGLNPSDDDEGDDDD